MTYAENETWPYDRAPKRRKMENKSNLTHARSTTKDHDTEVRSLFQNSSENSTPDMPDVSVGTSTRLMTSSREDLMARIKRGEKPTWVPSASFQALRNLENQHSVTSGSSESSKARGLSGSPTPLAKGKAHGDNTNARDPPAISAAPQRPRSALHRGDFASPSHTSTSDVYGNDPFLSGVAISTSPNTEQQLGRCQRDETQTHSLQSSLPTESPLSRYAPGSAARRRVPSFSGALSSSYVLRTPTSPLVHASTHSHAELTRDDATPQRPSARNNARRRTLPPGSIVPLSTAPLSESSAPNFSRPFVPHLRKETSMPIYGHQHSRSMSAVTYQPRSSPLTPLPRTRQSSANTDLIRRRTSMVGSFEESLLRGTMSTPSSQPLNFVAQIGVMGKGECSANLKCPPHVTVPFPAVFYNYPAVTSHRTTSDDMPSPYVGRVDLEDTLKPIILASKHHQTTFLVGQDRDKGKSKAADETIAAGTTIRLGGAYRVPRQGQLQIIVKNPNKTAVKLFLVPYDLEGMAAGTKTFARQRSYSTSTSPADEVAPTELGSTSAHSGGTKSILRYLIHVKFCCPAKNRFYLYDDIRVVFANRVPDGKEKLRNEIQVPEPKYSTWKPMTLQPTAKDPFADTSSPDMSSSRAQFTANRLDEFIFRSPDVSITRQHDYSGSPLPRVPPLKLGSPSHSTLEPPVSSVASVEAARLRPLQPTLHEAKPTTFDFKTLHSLSLSPEPRSSLLSQQFNEMRSKKLDEKRRMDTMIGNEAASSDRSLCYIE